MGYFSCRCGHSIDEKEPPNSSEARFVLDDDEESFFEGFTTQIADFMAAVADGKRAEWITNTYSKHWVSASDKSVVYSLLGDHMLKHFRSMLECPACGRIYVQGKEGGGYLHFRPEPFFFDPTLPTKPVRRLGEEEWEAARARHARTAWQKIYFSGADDQLSKEDETDYGRLINARRLSEDEP